MDLAYDSTTTISTDAEVDGIAIRVLCILCDSLDSRIQLADEARAFSTVTVDFGFNNGPSSFKHLILDRLRLHRLVDGSESCY